MARSSSPRAYLFPRSGAPGKRLNARVPAGALLHWEPGSAVVGPCCCGSLVTEEPGLAAWDGLEVCVLRGLRQGLGSGGQECIEVLQPCDTSARANQTPRLCFSGSGNSVHQAPTF